MPSERLAAVADRAPRRSACASGPLWQGPPAQRRRIRAAPVPLLSPPLSAWHLFYWQQRQTCSAAPLQVAPVLASTAATATGGGSAESFARQRTFSDAAEAAINEQIK